ncbi:hypothetical protein FMV2238Y02_00520 [Streptococcus canis]|uniref:DUF4651 domain-containing protein n=2 Tax=Streptococcus canis TaxID=1329 RepID=A0A3P5Y6A2_STRCB|nr:hypothetical protein FMV2238Y02_00520 [Streptococcus canis]
MKGMNKKKIGIISGLLGTGLVIGLGIMINDYCQEKERQQVTRDLRAFFSKLGQIDVLYVTTAKNSSEPISGGVVMADGKQYQYVYHQGHIGFEEE